MGISDTLWEAVREIDAYLADGMYTKDPDIQEIKHVRDAMDTLRKKLDTAPVSR